MIPPRPLSPVLPIESRDQEERGETRDREYGDRQARPRPRAVGSAPHRPPRIDAAQRKAAQDDARTERLQRMPSAEHPRQKQTDEGEQREPEGRLAR